MPTFRLTPLALVITSSLALSTHAEEVNSENVQEREVERIIIQGTKQELTLQEVDASIELFTEARLDAERIVDINDALLRIPNVASTGASDSITIRGIGRTGSTNSGQGVTSNVYVDGSPLSGTALGRGVTSLWDTQQVEVLRGSQSSIQGRNALAGAIVVSTADPTYEADGKFRLTAAEDSTYQIAGAYGNAIIDDQLAFRVAADYQKTDGYIDSIFFDKNTDFENRLLLRAKLLFEPEAIDDLSIKLTVDHNNISVGNGVASVNTTVSPTDESFESFNVFDFIDSGTFPRNRTETTRVILESYYDISKNWSIKTIITNEDTDVERNFGSDDPEIFSQVELFTDDRLNEEINTAELRFTFDYGNISGVIGGYYFDADNKESTFDQALLAPQITVGTRGLATTSPADSAAIVLTNDNITSTINRAFFAQVRIDLNKALTLDLGVRYDDERFTNSGAINQTRTITPDECAVTGPGAIFGVPVDSLISVPCSIVIDSSLGAIPEDDLTQEVSFNAWLPKATLTYKFNEEHSIFASAQRGYRAGGTDLTIIDNPNGTGTIQSIFSYDPEFLNTVEIGSRSVFANGDIILNNNVFFSTYKDQQINTPGVDLNNNNDDLIINAAESTIYGLETSFQYFITQEWEVFASLGLLNAEFDDFPFALEGEFSNLAGNKLPNSPEVTGSIGVNWVGQSGLFANVSAFYTGSRFSFFDNIDNDDLFPLAVEAGVSEETASTLTEKVDSYVNVNARFGYEYDNFTVYTYVTNLFDEEVVTRNDVSAIDQVSGELSLDANGTFFNVLPSRTFGIGIDYSF
ncbi:TonB-dependent receptor [Alteromonas sp. 5E99-2]|uniref:TonB-dependent receptor n=1 Tax=Alteromonas sp. 5E99-2 TaxID=2817683 RepID=UPI001A97EDCD|nr:TonB-dependent receptor [Alteromonas sp. 5E99-2]MBO1255101.1 TonB-dependent receptor [Alteromonas sp. 5E99-2]